MFEDKLFIHKATGNMIKIKDVMICDYESRVTYVAKGEHGQYPDKLTGMLKLTELKDEYLLYDDYVKSTDINDDVIRLIKSGVKINHIQCKTIDGKDIVIKLSN